MDTLPPNNVLPQTPPPQPVEGGHKLAHYLLGICVTVLVIVVAGVGLLWYKQHILPVQGPMVIGGITIPTAPTIPNTIFSTSTAQTLAVLYGRLQEATSTSQQAGIRRTIANVSFAADPSAGYAQLESIAADTSYSKVQRALAVQTVGDIYFNRSGQSTVALDYVFATPPYSAMVTPTEPKDAQLWDGMKNVYLYALSFADSPISDYRVALWYLNDAESTTSKSALSSDITQAQNYLGVGNVGLNRFVTTLNPQDGYMEADAMWLQAAVTGQLGTQTKNKALVQTATTLFANTRGLLTQQLAATTATSLPTRDELNIELLWADFNYAALLTEQPATTANTTLVNQLLAEIVQTNNPRYGFSRWLAVLQATTPTVQTMLDAKKNVVAFSTLSPAFAAMVTSIVQNTSPAATQ